MLLVTILTLAWVSYVSSRNIYREFSGDCGSSGWRCENETMIYDCSKQSHTYDVNVVYIWQKKFSPDKLQFIVRNCFKLLLHVDHLSLLKLNETKRHVTVENVFALQMNRASITAGTPVMLPHVIKLQNITSLTIVPNVMNSTNDVLLKLKNVTVISDKSEWSNLPRLSLSWQNFTLFDSSRNVPASWSFHQLKYLSLSAASMSSKFSVTSVREVVIKQMLRKDDKLFGQQFIRIEQVDRLLIEGCNNPQSLQWIISGTTNSTINIINSTINIAEESIIKGGSINIIDNNIKNLKNLTISAKQLTISNNNIELAQNNSFDCDTVNISSNTINLIDSRGLYVLNNNNTIVENNNIINVGKTGITITSEYVGITGNTFQNVHDQSLIFNVNNPNDDDNNSYFVLELNFFNIISSNAFKFYYQFYHVLVQNNAFLCRCGNRDWFENVHTSLTMKRFNHTFIESLILTNNNNKCMNRDCVIGFYVDRFDQLCSHNHYQPDNCIIDKQTANQVLQTSQSSTLPLLCTIIALLILIIIALITFNYKRVEYYRSLLV